MIDILSAIILGIIQGLTEFIPISSTAHLTIAGNLMGLIDASNPERWTAFIAVIQLGTLVAVLVYFSQDIKSIPIAFVKENFTSDKKGYKEQSSESRMGWLIIIGSLPIFTLGLILKKLIEGNFTKDPLVIASSLIILAVILLVAEKMASLKKDITKINIKDSIIIGFAQAVALIPGSSRSGTTITAGLFLGLTRETAARFSFLLSIPAIFASGLYQFYKALEYINTNDVTAIIIATIVSGISGYFAIAFLINYLKKHSTNLFIIYRIVLGIVLILMVYKGIL